jgi:hypothetical protein
MDMAVFLFMQEDEELEADIIDDELYNTQLSAALLISGAQEAQTSAVSVATYLRRPQGPQLQPNPRVDTPWQVSFSSKNDRAFITTMGFDVVTFKLIVMSGFGDR